MSFQWSLADRSIGKGFVRIAQEQIDKAIASADSLAELPGKRVHEARRRCKKLRALLRLVRPDFPAYGEENAFIRDAARGLSAARDTAVTRQTLAGLMKWAGRESPAPLADETADDAAEAEALGVFAGRMRELRKRSAEWRIHKIDLETLARGLTDTYRKGQEAGEAVARNPSDTGFHEWRKHAKYRWNQIGLLEACAEDILPSEEKCAGELSELLGLHHDLAVLRHAVTGDPQQLAADLDTAFVLDAIERRQAELEEKIAVLGRQVFAESPKAVEARFLAYLEGWMGREAAE